MQSDQAHIFSQLLFSQFREELGQLSREMDSFSASSSETLSSVNCSGLELSSEQLLADTTLSRLAKLDV